LIEQMALDGKVWHSSPDFKVIEMDTPAIAV
jgi:hypothetical protein